VKVRKKTLRFVEFFLVGVVMGISEDVLAVWFSTGEPITLRVVWIVFLVALPFAIISEYVVDHPRFWKTVFRMKDEDKLENKQSSR
jgi:hypothetical protein